MGFEGQTSKRRNSTPLPRVVYASETARNDTLRSYLEKKKEARPNPDEESDSDSDIYLDDAELEGLL